MGWGIKHEWSYYGCLSPSFSLCLSVTCLSQKITWTVISVIILFCASVSGACLSYLPPLSETKDETQTELEVAGTECG